MASYAIVIGINEYKKNAAWNLRGPVNDALSFARWSLAEGGVPPENLELLLSPDGGAEVDLPFKPADRDQIGKAIDAFIDGRGKDGDRLYFYYAGHGVSAPGVTQGGIQEPVLLPEDVESLRQTHLFLSFSNVMPRLLNSPPQTQFFFIDACRDFALEDEFVEGAGAFYGRWSPPKPEAGPRSSQYVIYATAPGLKAHEKKLQGRGLFGPPLLKGLCGETSATVWRSTSYELTFDTLYRYVRAQVERAVDAVEGSSTYVQLPEPQTVGGPPDVVLSSYKERPPVPVKVRVDPKAARPSCRVKLVYPTPGGGESPVVETDPPAKYTSTFQVAPGDYVVRAEASEYATAEEAISLYEAVTVPFELEPALLAAAGGGFAVTRGIEGLDEGADGTLEVHAVDEFAPVVIWDSEQRHVKQMVGESFATELSPGIYRVQLLLPDGPADEKTIQIRAGRTTIVNLRPAPHRFGSAQADVLERHGLHVREGYVHVAESIGAVASPPMASLLGFAAFAAQWPTEEELDHLRGLGVHSFSDLPEGRSALLVLVGTSADEPGKFSTGGDFIVRGSGGQVLHEGGYEPLDGFPAAAQAHIELDPGPMVLELRLPGLAPTRYALSALPNRVTVLIAVAEGPGAFETQQYVFPCDEAGFREAFPDGDPKHVRALELAQRYYAGGRQLPELWDIDALLVGKWLDPLLACVAGYSLARSGHAERFVGDGKEQSAMRNMLKFFGELPDSHVLAGLCEPEHTAEHFSNALARGLPIFSDGLRALHDWYANRDAPPPALREPAESLLPGSPWTAWVASRID